MLFLHFHLAFNNGQQSQEQLSNMPALVHGTLSKVGGKRTSADRLSGEHEEPGARIQRIPRTTARRRLGTRKHCAHRQPAYRAIYHVAFHCARSHFGQDSRRDVSRLVHQVQCIFEGSSRFTSRAAERATTAHRTQAHQWLLGSDGHQVFVRQWHDFDRLRCHAKVTTYSNRRKGIKFLIIINNLMNKFQANSHTLKRLFIPIKFHQVFCWFLWFWSCIFRYFINLI